MNKFIKTLSNDWFSASIVGVLPIFLATNLIALIVWTLQIPTYTMGLILGAMAAGLTDLDNRFTGRLKNLFFTLIAFAISSLSSQFALSHGWFIPLITILTFCMIMLSAIGQRYSTIAFSTLLMAVYTAMIYSPTAIWYEHTALIIIGAIIYGIIAMIVYLLFPHRIMQENLALYFEALGKYLQARANFFDPDEMGEENLPQKQLILGQANIGVMSALDRARTSLFYRLRIQHRHSRTRQMLRYFFSGQEIWEIASSHHTEYATFFRELQNTDLVFRFQRIIELQAIACQQIANDLRHDSPYEDQHRIEKALKGLSQSLNYHKENGIKHFHHLQSIADNLQNIENQLVQISDPTIDIKNDKKAQQTARLIPENISNFQHMIQAIKNQCNLGSPLFRHAIRLSVVVFFSALIAEIFYVEQGYWILLTAILVSQPNYSATKKRLIQRVIGTILGVIVGLSFPYLSPTLGAQLGLIVVSSSLFFFFKANKFGFSTFFITIQVLISFDVVGFGLDNAMLPRILDTLMGALIAWLAAAYLWPDWKYLNLHQSLKDMLVNSATYLRHITAQLQFGYKDQLSYRVARRSAQNSLAQLSSVISNMMSEPKKYQAALEFVPELLNISYSLSSHIATLGSYRRKNNELNHDIEFASIFFKQSKLMADLLDQMAIKSEDTEQTLKDINKQLQDFEEEYESKIDAQNLILLQQLRLIIQILPQLWIFVGMEKQYHKTHNV
ncbi:YccS family putative transporter [Otariodibacter oris]|uniref:Putative membrane protein (TIGR01666 family) n=1 Tax=Otariodibacter oris TaxID=1032623 RepID=A0A420XF04_9PAST|nr:YccS family putative transporter [Otariodibacter oris]QGM81494.1 TIGR01666 family membrane protein [Otariodibacter oris]RKR71100.1 putative membrane protein (TIGR01666 family) [Otariodibacter oris]